MAWRVAASSVVGEKHRTTAGSQFWINYISTRAKNQSVRLRAKAFKHPFINPTDWFDETPIRTSQ